MGFLPSSLCFLTVSAASAQTYWTVTQAIFIILTYTLLGIKADIQIFLKQRKSLCSDTKYFHFSISLLKTVFPFLLFSISQAPIRASEIDTLFFCSFACPASQCTSATDLTDDLHDHFDFRTDLEFISKSRMRTIIKNTKNLPDNNIAHIGANQKSRSCP